VIVRKDDLRPEGLHLDVHPRLGPLESEGGLEISVSGAALSAEIVPTEQGLHCRGRLVAAASIVCSRCLETYVLPVDKTFDVRYVRPPRAAGGEPEHQIARDEFDVSYLGAGETLETDDMAAEQVYLSLPMKPLCREDCKGLCPGCGVNLNNEACRCGMSR